MQLVYVPPTLPPTQSVTVALDQQRAASADAAATGEDLKFYCQEEVIATIAGPDARQVAFAPARSRAEKPDPNDLRLRLLARKYGRSSFSPQDEARLEIVTARLEGLIRQVEEEDFEELAKTAERVLESQQLRERIAKKYGGK
jgi:hypothetical protein